MNAALKLSIGLAAALGLGLITLQSSSIRRLQSEVDSLKQRIGDAEQSEASPQFPNHASPLASRPQTVSSAGITQRLAILEQSIEELLRASDYLMDQGDLPLGERKIADLYRQFTDMSLSDRDRLRALNLLRENRALTAEMEVGVVNWLQAATERNTRRSLLRALSGTTNTAVLRPLISFATHDQDSEVRESAINHLRRFLDEPGVEQTLWQLAFNDPNADIREEALEQLERRPLSPGQISQLQGRAGDPSLPLDDRLQMLRMLDRADAEAPLAIALLIQDAQETADPAVRRRLFDAFEDINNPAVALPLVHGLQDPDARVRRSAADALESFKEDPAVIQWLKYVAEHDPDPQVRREALRSLDD